MALVFQASDRLKPSIIFFGETKLELHYSVLKAYEPENRFDWNDEVRRKLELIDRRCIESLAVVMVVRIDAEPAIRFVGKLQRAASFFFS